MFGSYNEPCPQSVIESFNKACEGHYGEYGPCYEQTAYGTQMVKLNTNHGEVASDGKTYALSVKILKTGQCTVGIERRYRP